MKTIREIKEELQAASGMEREKLLELYREDTRSGYRRKDRYSAKTKNV